MEKAYWLRRESASLEAAEKATGPEARLAHYDLAGRYSIKAAAAVSPSSMEAKAAPITMPEDAAENTDV
jgi:hypothetical protein